MGYLIQFESRDSQQFKILNELFSVLAKTNKIAEMRLALGIKDQFEAFTDGRKGYIFLEDAAFQYLRGILREERLSENGLMVPLLQFHNFIELMEILDRTEKERHGSESDLIRDMYPIVTVDGPIPVPEQ